MEDQVKTSIVNAKKFSVRYRKEFCVKVKSIKQGSITKFIKNNR